MAEGLMDNIKMLREDNIDVMIKQEWAPRAESTILVNKRKRAHGPTGLKLIKLSLPMQLILSEQLNACFGRMFELKYPKGSLMCATDLFGKTEVDLIIKKFGKINGPTGLRKIIGGEMIDGQVEALDKIIKEFIAGPVAAEKRDRADTAKKMRQEKKRIQDEEQGNRATREAEVARATKLAQEQAKRLEREAIEAQRQVELAKKQEDLAQLAILVRIAGEKAEREGWVSIHRGR
jgi:hypothetical protein